MLHMINWDALRHKRFSQLIVDLVMLSIALFHLVLIGFDMTYFRFRPLYMQWWPQMVTQYDLLKGVEPHQDTWEYMTASERFFMTCRMTQTVPAEQIKEMITRSNQMIEEDPFSRAKLSGRLEMIKAETRNFTAVHDSSKRALAVFWQAGCEDLGRREAFYVREIKPHLQVNFWRRIGFNGEYVDDFVYIDLCFILLFLLEFVLSWRQAMRQFGPDQKVLYPLYHWYDLVSCIPLQQFRFLRLLRLVTLYYRLVQSNIISLHHSRLYQKVVKYQSIVMEEISDRVAINILTNIQAKTRLGGSKELIKDTLLAHREEIRDVILLNLHKIELPSLQSRQKELTQTLAALILQSIQATDEYKQIASLPVISGLIHSVLNQERIAHISEQAMDAFLEGLHLQLQTPETQSLIQDILDDVLDQTLTLALDQRIQILLQDMNLKILEELKEISTTSKIWKSQSEELLLEAVHEREKDDKI